jgi:hypothetical protein
MIQVAARAHLAQTKYGIYPGRISPAGRIFVPSLIGFLAFYLLAWSAQLRSGDNEFNLPGHALAMTGLLWWAALICRELGRSTVGRIAAAVAALAMVLGPMSLSAGPGAVALFAADGSPVPWWSVAIAVAELALIGGLTAWLMYRRPATGPSSLSGAWANVTFGTIFVVALAALLAVPAWTEDPGHGMIPTRMILGWTGVATGAFVASVMSRSWSVRIALIVLPALTMAEMFFAYNRGGGWPAVPGWEQLQSPLYLTVVIAVLAIAMPALGVLTGEMLRRFTTLTSNPADL